MKRHCTEYQWQQILALGELIAHHMPDGFEFRAQPESMQALFIGPNGAVYWARSRMMRAIRDQDEPEKWADVLLAAAEY